MQSSDMIEVVTHLLAVGSVKLLYSRMRLPFLRALRLYWWRRGRTFHSDVRHRSLQESDVVLLVGKVEIPVIGRDGEISGVLCRNLLLTSASRPVPLTQDPEEWSANGHGSSGFTLLNNELAPHVWRNQTLWD
jgi:hypothetical protein